MTRLVLLPGMDGTGELFGAFADTVRADTQVVRYPSTQALDYAELEQFVLSKLPRQEPFVLLGESFSGPVALSIAASRPALLRGIGSVSTSSRNCIPLPRPCCIFALRKIAWCRMRPLASCWTRSGGAGRWSLSHRTSCCRPARRRRRR